MATTTVDSHIRHKRVSNNLVFWLILIAIVLLIAVGYATRSDRDLSTPPTDTTRAAPSTRSE